MKGLLVQCHGDRMVSKHFQPLGTEKTLRKAGSSDIELYRYRLDRAKSMMTPTYSRISILEKNK